MFAEFVMDGLNKNLDESLVIHYYFYFITNFLYFRKLKLY